MKKDAGSDTAGERTETYRSRRQYSVIIHR